MRSKNGKISSGEDKVKPSVLTGVFLISFTLIAFEIALSRLLSVLFSYHYVFAVLSLALLGLGTGGMLVHFITPGLETRQRGFARWGFLYSLAIPFSILLTIQIGYFDFPRIGLLFFGLLLFLPFLFGGALLAEIYRRFSRQSGRVYGLDMIGAGVGSFGAVLLLDVLGGIATHFVLGAIAFAGVLLLAVEEVKKGKRWFLPLFCLLGLSLMFVIKPSDEKFRVTHVGANPAKEIHDAFFTFKGRIIESRWSSFGRTDLVEYANIPDQMDIYLDGTAGSPMYRFSGDTAAPGRSVERLKDEFPGYFPFGSLKEDERDNALIVGPGGGRDILLALMGGIRRVIAVEINKDQVEMVRKYSPFNGGIYAGFSNVEVIIDEGRSFLKRQLEKYDVIMLSLPVTNTSRSLEGYALTESFLLTVESVNDYLDHLTDEGRLIFVGHNDAEILRLLSVSLSELNRRAVNTVSAMQQIYLVGSEEYPVLVMKKTPFDPLEMLAAYNLMIQMGYEQQSSYFPFVGQEGMLNPALADLAKGRVALGEFIRMVGERGYDIRPVSDNSPFFYKFEMGTPRPLLMIFGFSGLSCLIAIFIPLVLSRRRSDAVSFRTLNKSLLLFLLLGTGFMLIEISLIQKFGLFLGHPVLSVAVLLFSILGGAGLGSLLSGRIRLDNLRGGLRLLSILILSAALVYVFLLPVLFSKLLGLGLPTRMLVSFLMLLPISTLLGFPFPMGIRMLKYNELAKSIPWMWGINGMGSVLGSALALIISINLGFTEALLTGASCYSIIFLLFLNRGMKYS